MNKMGSDQSSLRVAMLSYHTCPLATLGGKDTGGMNVYVRELTRQFGRLGNHVDVFTRSQDVHVPHVVHDLGYGNRVVHITSGPELPLPKQELAAHIPAFVESILDFTRRKNIRYDLIYSHYWMSGIAARDLKSEWQIPVVHMFHTLGLMKNRIARVGEYEGEYRIRGEREVLRVADKIIAATPAELAQLQWLYEVKTDHVTIVPPGVDITRFYPIPKDEARDFIGLERDTSMLLFVGRIEPLKGIDTLLEAMALMRDNGVMGDQKVCLAIIGGDAAVEEEEMSGEMARLQTLHESLGLGDAVSFLGKRSQDSLPYFYSAADVVVVPSHYESFGMVALEAMASGTPVVASQVGGLAYLIQDGETGFHVQDQDPETLADKLILLINDSDLHRYMSGNAAEVAQNYSWGVIADKLLNVFGGILKD